MWEGFDNNEFIKRCPRVGLNLSGGLSLRQYRGYQSLTFFSQILDTRTVYVCVWGYEVVFNC